MVAGEGGFPNSSVCPGALSARELEILLLAAYGLSHREIDEILHLAEATRRGLQEDWVTVSGVTEEIG